MDATRTQLEAAAQRFHYRRGFDDAMSQIQQESFFDIVLVAAMLIVAFVTGWLVGLRCSNSSQGNTLL